MERKIISLGRSSLVISLPKDWIELNELKKSDVVSLAVQRDRSLVVFPYAEKKKEPVDINLHIDANERESSIVRKLIGCYLSGYSGIRVISNNIFSVPQGKAIRNIAGKLYMRVMVSDAKSMTIQTLIDESKASLELAINRMHLISDSMCADLLNVLKTGNMMLAKAVYSLDEDVDHFSYFILRLLRSSAQDPVLANVLGIDTLDCMDYQTLVRRIEHAADFCADMARNAVMLGESENKIPNNILTLISQACKEAIDLYDRSVKNFFSKNVMDSVEILDGIEKVEKLDREIASRAFLHKQDNLVTCGICSMREDIRGIAESAANIAEVSIDRTYKMTV
ncbi:MAG TPA: phosphate uptake regulator PhoU [Candidatus Acidoferrum sp.]|nr:phosphate uptake regulator PhoU [Candidatus Acidoferrum sp.]